MKRASDTHRLDLDAAEALAFRAVAFIASDDAYLADFLSRSGLSPQSLAESIEDRAFLTGVLDHLLADESLLLAFCGNAGIDPADILPARNALSPS
ncbi:DUF3572 domain-containing protein [Dichotomicrobium thermohalophilum]|uniref:Uncharacterized protein DUF3572 n=1 Tax=Dichotomicrobium thermohalophilum TaxID=933063 RepID=A0A397PFN2_9HYPH|nr:DUF3572 domain-containing protein [Dichotomicrobium thermohalophilum]RIA47768.1 uncharacterized protein DUF3572 [Dichotomicrobium thermohalophilum]